MPPRPPGTPPSGASTGFGVPPGSTPVQVQGNVELTPTELKVVQLVAQGMANREIAEKLNVSQRTIESHVSNMLHKTGLHNRTELTQWAIESNIIFLYS